MAPKPVGFRALGVETPLRTYLLKLRRLRNQTYPNFFLFFLFLFFCLFKSTALGHCFNYNQKNEAYYFPICNPQLNVNVCV